jgi:hypothetical protein
VLIGQWAWFKHDELIVTHDRSIIDINFSELIKLVPQKAITKVSTKLSTIMEKTDNVKQNELFELFKCSKYCLPALTFYKQTGKNILLRGTKTYKCTLCKREHVKNKNHPYLFETDNGYYFGCRTNVTLLKAKLPTEFKLLTPNSNIQTIEINEKFLKYDHKLFNDNDTIIIDSKAGTGKTTNTAKQLKQYLNKYPDMKILSLVNYRSLASQQIKSFGDAGITLFNYQNKKFINLNEGHYVLCINSLNKLKLDNIDLNKVIVYIDEDTSMIKTLTDNETLDRTLKTIYSILMKLLRCCNKVILSDANTTNNVYNLLKYRLDKPTLLIVNKYLKFINVNAIRERNEI